MKIEPTNQDKMANEINVNEVRASAFQSLLPISECNRLARCGDGISNQTASKSVLVSPSGSATANSYASNSPGNNGSSPKMGSRRIFTPQFKLQVLESYRSDSDCKGNQRATARKYNIHRRQIQKWLQCESNLRSSVANINQNSVKHQFHNISHHQQQTAQPPRLQLPHSTSSGSLNGATNGYSHHHPHHHSQALALNNLNVPSMPPRLDTTGSSSASAQGVLAAANLAAALAVAVASSSSPSTSTTAVSPLRPTAINGTSGGVNNGVSKLSPSLLQSHHHHHHHHFSMPPYTHSPVAGPVPVTVPMLTHHLGAAPPPHPHALHQHYPYHNLPSRTHHSLPLRLSHQPSAFLPTACLPVNVLSVAVAAASATDMPEKKAEENHTDANVELGESEAATPTTAVQPTMTAPPNAVLTESAHGYIHDANEYESMYRKVAASAADSDIVRDAKCKAYLQHSTYQYTEQDCLGASMTTPMDLSLGRKRRDSAATEENTDITKCHPRENSSTSSTTQIVDLTFRKRKVITASALSIDTEHPLKLAKRLEEADSNKTAIEYTNGSNIAITQSANEEDEEVEIEVDVESKQTSSKPVKLFKPYLLDSNDDDCDQSTASNQKESNSDLGIGEQREPIIWINHPAYDSSRASSMYSPSAEKHTFHGGSPYFLASKPSSPQSVLSPISRASLSPTNFLRCPKGSPVSGYESSSSVCSERDETCSLTECRSFSLDFQMQAAPENKLTSQPLHIRQWLDQETNTETNTPPLARASIALYA